MSMYSLVNVVRSPRQQMLVENSGTGQVSGTFKLY